MSDVRVLEPDRAWYGLEEELRGSFFAMEARRQQRQAYGRQVARGVWSAFSEVAMFLGFALYGVAQLRSRLLGPPQEKLSYLALPVLMTLGIFALSVYRSATVQDNLPLMWGKTWIALLVVWELWLYEPPAPCKGGPVPPAPQTWLTVQEEIVLSVFLTLEAITLVIWFWMQKIYPWLAMHCHNTLALRFFWRVRPSRRREGYSYLPNGCCSVRRRHFKYTGDEDLHRQPHGKGLWQGDAYHGEIYDGFWQHGRPAVPFVSRCFGSGSISYGIKIGYGTCRLEQLSQLRWKPCRINGALRLGSVGIECSASGGFMAHLPQLVEQQHQRFATAAELVDELRGSIVALDAGSRDDDAVSLGSFRSDISGPVAALIFVHGFNCPVDWACMRLGQLLTLGKFSSKILPLVFSWPTGTLSSFFHVRPLLPDFAADLPRFLRLLSEAGLQEFHLMAHSMGCELVMAALPELHQAVPLQTISFCNPSCPFNSFQEQLVQLASLCQRLTLYCDRQGPRGETLR
ncbi:unnamed protein product [Effrenium voratum]|nr:unnamed protein product [Effrenium voratum]